MSVATIRKLELGALSPRPSTTRCIREAIENAGLELLQPDGIRRRSEDVLIFGGLPGLSRLYGDMRKTLQERGGEVLLILNGSAPLFDWEELSAMVSKNGPPIKCLFTDRDRLAARPVGVEFRLISLNYVDPIPFCVYGNKYMMLEGAQDSRARIVVLSSLATTLALRRHFYSMWTKALDLGQDKARPSLSMSLTRGAA